MIDLNTGTVRLKDVSIPLSPSLTREQFQRKFPKERITGAWPLSSGYTWYFLKGQLYPQDSPASLQLCFAPEGQLLSLEIHPASAAGGDPWSPEMGQQRKDACDRWLETHCQVTLPPDRCPYPRSCRAYPWGELSTYYDPRSGNSGILLSYQAPIY